MPDVGLLYRYKYNYYIDINIYAVMEKKIYALKSLLLLLLLIKVSTSKKPGPKLILGSNSETGPGLVPNLGSN